MAEQKYKIGIESAAFMTFPIETTDYLILGSIGDQNWPSGRLLSTTYCLNSCYSSI